MLLGLRSRLQQAQANVCGAIAGGLHQQQFQFKLASSNLADAIQEYSTCSTSCSTIPSAVQLQDQQLTLPMLGVAGGMAENKHVACMLMQVFNFIRVYLSIPGTSQVQLLCSIFWHSVRLPSHFGGD